MNAHDSDSDDETIIADTSEESVGESDVDGKFGGSLLLCLCVVEKCLVYRYEIYRFPIRLTVFPLFYQAVPFIGSAL